MNIVMLGGNGYIGRETTRQWLERDPSARFVVLSRSGENALANDRIANVQADCADEQAIVKAVRGALPAGARVDCIVDFVGGMSDPSENIKPARAMVAAAEALNAPVMGYVGGAIGGKAFLESKQQAARLLKDSGRPTAVVSPTLVYGAGRSDAMTKMVPLMKFFGLFAKSMKPVRVEDVAKQLIDELCAIMADAR